MRNIRWQIGERGKRRDACLHACDVCYTLKCGVFVCHCKPSADVWSDGDLPPGWREISDSSEVYFWHVPTGTTQYHRPVASSNQHTSLNIEPDTEHNSYQEMKDSLKPPNEVRGPAARRNLEMWQTKISLICRFSFFFVLPLSGRSLQYIKGESYG